MPLLTIALDCPHCRTSLQNVPADGICPTCRTPVTEALQRLGVDPQTLEVCEDLLCTRCTYNLRTAHIEAICPECGCAVYQSLGKGLQTAGRQWLGSLRSGVATLIGVGIAVPLFVILIPVLTVLSAGALAGGALFSMGQFIILLVVYVLFCVGVFKTTASDSSFRARADSGTFSTIGRICALAPIAVFIGVVATTVMSFSAGPATSGMGFIRSILIGSIAGTALPALSLLCVCVCLRRIFVRAGKTGDRKLTSVLIGLLPPAFVAPTASYAIMMYVMQPMIASAMATAAATAAATAPAPLPPGTTVNTATPGVTVYNYSSGPGRKRPIAVQAPTATAPAVTPPSPAASLAMGIASLASCGGMILALACYIMGMIVLVRCRRVLNEALNPI